MSECGEISHNATLKLDRCTHHTLMLLADQRHMEIDTVISAIVEAAVEVKFEDQPSMHTITATVRA
jgi:hypothetical protein